MNRHLDGRRDSMVAMYQRGVGCGDIAHEFGVNPPAVRKALTRAGVYRSSRKQTRTATSVLVKDEMQKASLAEHVAEGGSIASWERAHSVSPGFGHHLWRKIISDMGVQAI